MLMNRIQLNVVVNWNFSKNKMIFCKYEDYKIYIILYSYLSKT